MPRVGINVAATQHMGPSSSQSTNLPRPRDVMTTVNYLPDMRMHAGHETSLKLL